MRVDIFYRDKSPKHQALVNLGGTIIFLIPVCVFLLLIGWEYVFSSWKVLEKSREAGGLPLVYLLKSMILLMPALLLLQAVPGLVRSVAVLKGRQELSNTA